MAMMENELCSAQREGSGFESADSAEGDPPGVLEERSEFLFHRKLAFVTYSRSRVEEPEDFHRYLRESLEPHLPCVGGPEGGKGTVEIFGSKELHVDGTLHYHVLLCFEPRVHWRKARQRFSVWVDVDGSREVDTTSIFIRKMKEREPATVFLQSGQSYIAKHGHVFGGWIGPQTVARKTEKHFDELIACDTRGEAKVLFRTHFKRQWCLQHAKVEAFLKKKRPDPAETHKPDFDVLPWRVPLRMTQWRQRSFASSRRGRAYPLIIEGNSRCGKTEWAMSWGTPAKMSGGWCMDELTKPGITHIVLNDIDWKHFPNKRDLFECQRHITVSGKCREQWTIDLGIPVIITCNRGNSVLLDPELGPYLKETGTTIVRLGNKKLFVEAVDS